MTPQRAEQEAMRALDLWWIGRGGALRSVAPKIGWQGEGIDYPALVVVHFESFWRANRLWFHLADYAVRHCHDVSKYPADRMMERHLWAMAVCPSLCELPSWERAGLLYRTLLGSLAEWLKANPLPKPPKEFEEV